MPIIPPDIIAAARASQAKWSIPASISLAQWAVESGWGKKVSGKNNYGGITAKVSGAKFPTVPGEPLEPATLCWTSEFVNGQKVRCQRWFKDYASAEDYFDAHGKLLATGKPYAKARALLPDANAFADALTGVYATDPKYGATLKSIIKSNNLRSYDNA